MRIRHLFGAFIGYLIYPISLLTVRDNKKWCLGGEANSKYFYLLADFKSYNIRAIFFSNDKALVKKYKNIGYEAYTKLSIIGLYHLLTSGVYIITHGIGDVNRWTCGNVKIINLFHGLPIKKFGLVDIRHKPSIADYILRPTSINQRIDLQLSTSPFIEKIFREAFKIKNNNFVESIMPRDVILLQTKEQIIEFLYKIKENNTLDIINKIKEFSQAFIYMPTFRDTGRDFIKEANFDFEKLDELMSLHNAVFIFKLHVATKQNIEISAKKYKHILILPRYMDVYPILPFTSTLITDYSSVYFDYILMKDKRVIFYIFDYKKYQDIDRDLCLDINKLKGIFCYTFNDLLSNLAINNYEKISYEEIIELFYNKNHDINMSKIIKAIINITKYK